MNTKLTLNIQDKELIEAAKAYARSQNKSLSVLMENVLRGLVSKEVRTTKVKGKLSSKLVGAFISPNKNTEEDDDKWEYLKEKYNL